VREHCQATHPAKKKPELVARGPNQCWSWDITKLKAPRRGEHYDCYVVLDILSRYVVAWCVAPTEPESWRRSSSPTRSSATRSPGPAHGPRGSGELYDLEPGHRAAHVLGHRPQPQPSAREQRQPLLRKPVQDAQVLPDVPERFGPIQDARASCEQFSAYYCHEHRHTGIGYHTPASVYYGTAAEVRAQRAETLEVA
jgi:putative transposase